MITVVDLFKQKGHMLLLSAFLKPLSLYCLVTLILVIILSVIFHTTDSSYSS